MDAAALVRETIYKAIVTTGRVPSTAEIAEQRRIDEGSVRNGLKALSDAHVIILTPDSSDVWAAPPFAANPTSFRVHASHRSFYALCAWDAFGIPAVLREDAAIDARCAWSGVRISSGVKNGRAYGDGIIHLEVPARRFWDDIFYT
jgi:hypothetical protein